MDPVSCIFLNRCTLYDVNAKHLFVFCSGEKPFMKEWPGFIEIKGRVRLEPFEKFLKELPLSRTRAIMVIFFFDT
jgi:SPOC domain